MDLGPSVVKPPPRASLGGPLSTGAVSSRARAPAGSEGEAGRRPSNLSQSPDGRLVGTVSQWNEKGYGFADMQDGRRVYIHHSFCGGNHLAEGFQISCLVVPDAQNPGKWQAQQVVLVGQVARLTGTVTSWSDKGFGFGDFQDGRHAYLHKSQCEGEHLVQGETISAVLVPDSQNAGKWQAQEILRGGVASSSKVVGGLAPSQPGRLSGVVSSWSEKGYGFVDFEDGRRAYVHNSFCGGEHLVQGETVTAVLTPDAQNPGKWQATQIGRGGNVPTFTPKRPASVVRPAIYPTVDMSGGASLEGVVSQWNEKGYGFADFQDGRRAYIHASFCAGEHLTLGERIAASLVPDSQKPDKWQAHQVVRLSKPVPGVVSDWKIEGGYGFVNLEDGRRAYIHRTALGGTGDLTIGSQVHVTLKPDSRNPGKWCVDQIVDTETLAAAAAVAGGEDPAGMLWTTPGMNPDSLTGFTPSSGVVSDWNPKGFGFINLEDGRRAYVHNSQCGGEHLTVGEVVSLSVGPDDRTPGKWQAQNVVRSGVIQEPPTKRVRAS